MFLYFLIFNIISSNEEKDFWDEIDNDEIIIEDKIEGKLYSKARFDIPIKRRLRLYPEVAKIVQILHGISNIEFVYESKKPILYFLDSQDIIIENIDISQMTQDEIRAVLNLRGFAMIGEEFDELANNIEIENKTIENL